VFAIVVTALVGCSSAPSGAPPPVNAARSSAVSRPSAPGVFAVVRKRAFGPEGPNPSLVAIDPTSVFLTGAFSAHRRRVTLVRLDRKRLTTVASAALPDTTDVTYGDGMLWWATGRPNYDTGCNCTPPPASRELLRIDPTTLRVTARYTLPGPPLLVTTVGSALWVATPTRLLRIDPLTGRVLASHPVGFYPVSIAVAPNSSRMYILGDKPHAHQAVISAYSPTTGTLLAKRVAGLASAGPLAVTADGVLVPTPDATKRPQTTIRLFSGAALSTGPVITGLAFDTEPYTDGAALWLIDSAGRSATICANRETGSTIATGPPVGTGLGVMASNGQDTYLVEDLGTADSLLQIQPRPGC
jgi:DNA-binding beta-propeller fold protein YncE